jgi:ABC-2 type transport system permease protein
VTAPAQFTAVARAELCKLRSVRSTWWTLVATLAFNVFVAVALAIVVPGQLSSHEKATLDSPRVSLAGLHLSQVAIGVLGVLVISTEYTTGTIRSTLAAIPQRRLMLAAKTLVFGAVALVVGIASCLAAYLAFNAFLADASLRTSLSDPGVLRAVLGGGLFLGVLGLFGLGLGTVLRSSSGGVAALLGLMFVPPVLLELLPHALKDSVGPYVPLVAASTIFSTRPEAGALGTWTGFGLFCLYAAAALAAAFVLIDHRDA